MTETDFETIKKCCIRVAVEAYEDALQSGLCAEGAFEAAVSAIKKLKSDQLPIAQDKT